MRNVLDWRLHSPVGIALSLETVHISGAGTWPITPWSPTDDGWESLRDALTEARHVLERTESTAAQRGELAIALLPPLSMFRVVQLPKLSDADLAAVLARGIARYFPAIRDRQLIAAERLGGESPARWDYAVAVASSMLVHDIQRAALAAGWTVTHVIPAYAAWAAAAPRLRATRTGESLLVIRRSDGGMDLLHVARGIPRAVRRLRAGDPEAAHPPTGAIRVETPAELAARTAPRTHRLSLDTEATLAQRHARRRRLGIAAAVAAVVCLAGGMLTYARHINSQLHDVFVERMAIRGPVTDARKLDAAFNAVAQPAQALARVEERGARWSVIINDLATALPPDAYIESLRASHDTLTIDGAAEVGARVFQAVGASDLLTGVTPVGSIRRDIPLSAGGPAGVPTVNAAAVDQRERFTLTARIANAAPLVPAPKRGKKP